ACFPRFDSPAVFCRILDAEHGGHFSVAVPSAPRPPNISRSYLEDTNVLVTTFESDEGDLEVTDCMPVGRGDPADPTSVRAEHAVLRRLRCTRGQVDVEVEVAPRFEYATFVPRVELASPTTREIVGGRDALGV